MQHWMQPEFIFLTSTKSPMSATPVTSLQTLLLAPLELLLLLLLLLRRPKRPLSARPNVEPVDLWKWIS